MSASRILYVVSDPISTRLLRGQLSMLRSEGYEVDLASGPGAELGTFAAAEGATAHAVPLVREPSPVRDLWALVALVSLMLRVRPALVHASTPKAGLLATAAAWVTRRPVRVYLVRGLRFETATGRGRRLLVALERLVCRMATHVVFNSASARDLAVREGVVSADKALLLGRGSSNGIDMSRFDRLPPRDEARRGMGFEGSAPVLGFVGRLTADKGIDDLVQVFQRLVGEGRDVRLLLVGDIEDADPPTHHTRRVLDEDPRVVVVGWVPDPVALYPAMDLLVFPSRREGLPNVPLEAQACGIPLVGYAATGTVDAVVDGRTARLVPVGDVDGLGTAVSDVLDDPDEAARLGAAGREWVAEEFAQERVWAELVRAYDSWLR